MQQVLNGTVHEEVINQQPPQQQQPPPPPAQQHPYITEPTTQSQFVQEAELSNGEQQQQPQQQVESEPQTQTEERNDQPETEAFTASAQEAEPEHQVSNTTVNNSGPKTYANLVKSFPSTTNATSPQAPKLSMSPVSIVSM